MAIERICMVCHKRIKPGSKLKIYCKCKNDNTTQEESEGVENDKR